MTVFPSYGIQRLRHVPSIVDVSSLSSLQAEIEHLQRDEVWNSEILDWVLPDVKVDNWGLPGHGAARADCGSFFMRACFNVDEHPDHLAVFQPFVHRCFDPKCPEDWRFWLLREADRISTRIETAMKQKSWMGTPIHYMESVPQKLWHLSKEKLIHRAYAIAKRNGFLGGACIWHPFRETDDGRWYYSPHFHFLGFGWITEGAMGAELKKSGWLVKNLRIRESSASVFGTAYYQLTHCGVWYGPNKRHSVTWFGELSYNKLKIPKSIDDRDQVVCPYCGQPLKSVHWVGDGSSPLPCSGIGGFYLAPSDGWETREESFMIAQALRLRRQSEDWNQRG
jgi:hypothetical protein